MKPRGEQRELLCTLCGREHPTWYADNELWNRVVRLPDGSDRWPFLCPTCFTVKAAEAGETAPFRVSQGSEAGEGRMTREEWRERLREILLRSRGGEYPGWLDRVEGEILALLEQEPPRFKRPADVRPLCLSHITDGYCVLPEGHGGPHEYSEAHDSEAVALLEQEPRTFDGQTMAQWADTLDAARDDMMMVEDYEPSDVAHVMTICANLLRGAHLDSEAGGEGG